MNKRGQFTIFIILALVIIIITGIVLYFATDLFETGVTESIAYPSEIQEVADWNLECLEVLAKEAVVEISKQAGHYVPNPDSSYASEAGLIPYAYFQGSNILLTPDEVEQNIEQYIADNALINCYLDNVFLDEFLLTSEIPEVDATIEEDKVDLSISIPMTAFAGQSTFNIDRPYELSVPANMGLIYSAAFFIVDASVAEPDFFNYDLMLEQGVDVEILNMNDESYVFLLRDSTSFEGEEDFVFAFAGLYPIEEEETI